MKRSHPIRRGVAPGILALLSWFLVGSDPTGRPTEVASDRAGQSFSSSQRIAEAAGHGSDVAPRGTLQGGAGGGPAARDQPPRDPRRALREVRLQPSGGAAPDIGGRVGDHGDGVGSTAPDPEPRGAANALQQEAARTALPGAHTDAPTDLDHARVPPAGDAAPDVAVRVGDHGEYERVVFEWPEGIAHDVTHHGENVAVAFSRPGRIDFSAVRDRLGDRVLEAQSGDGDATRRVVLRVLPDASIRSFSLENDRIVVVDVFGGSATQDLAQPASDQAQDSIRELRRQLVQRDAVIESLLARVEQLERNVVLSGSELDRVAAGQAPAAGESSLPQPDTSSGAAADHSPSAPATRQDTAGEGSQGADSAAAQAQPGQIQVDEEEIDRALERTLVQTGVLLLPMGQAEVEPFFSYTREETDANMVVFAENGLSVGAEVDVRRNEFVTGETLRFGMPFDSQVEFGFPYRFVDQSMVASVDGGRGDEVSHFGHGMGDMSIGVAKTLLRENGHWWPDLIGRITWDSATGKTTSNDIALGGGFNELRASLSAVKRQDPLAFIGGVSYETTFERDDVKPGDQLGFSIGTVLAASPSTSLRVALDQRFVGTAKSDGEGVPGSDFVTATATLGASVILGPGVLLDIAADIGLTDESPDYAARASLPIRFNLPVF